MAVLYGRGARVLWRQTRDRVLLLHATDGEMVSLTGTGVVLWDLLAEPMELSRLSEVMSAAYGVSADVITADVAPVLDDLSARQLVETSQ